MNAEIICIGDELLIGQTVNTNAAFIGSALNENGFSVIQSLSISDQPEAITTALDAAMGRSRLVVLTGGLGPTRDDLTKHTLTAYFGAKLISDTATLERIEGFFKARNLPMLEINRQQAMVPDNCTVLHNLKGTANGMWFEKNDTIVVSLPGVPYEMKWLMEHEVLPRLIARNTGHVIVNRTYLTQGVGESFIAEKLKDWEDDLRKQGLGLAYLPSPGQVKLRLSTSGSDRNALNSTLDHYENQLIARIGDIIYGHDKETLPDIIHSLMTTRNLTLAVAESCTGGKILKELTAVAGASQYLKGGCVAYSKEMKMNVLNVETGTVHHHIYSETCALEMARGMRNLAGADIAIATTGVAGPGADPEYPSVNPGFVALAIAGRDWQWTGSGQFGRERLRVIEMAGNSLLFQLRKEILQRFEI
ncbi:MAG: CinA family nicotinamide mononucleotide deamidase-related protein [Flavobacteriales bacterium]|nr:CinA family nicotinamide mononucleotide deamidase-related protein [Flavobacteriales bacterium]